MSDLDILYFCCTIDYILHTSLSSDKTSGSVIICFLTVGSSESEISIGSVFFFDLPVASPFLFIALYTADSIFAISRSTSQSEPVFCLFLLGASVSESEFVLYSLSNSSASY